MATKQKSIATTDEQQEQIEKFMAMGPADLYEFIYNGTEKVVESKAIKPEVELAATIYACRKYEVPFRIEMLLPLDPDCKDQYPLPAFDIIVGDNHIQYVKTQDLDMESEVMKECGLDIIRIPRKEINDLNKDIEKLKRDLEALKSERDAKVKLLKATVDILNKKRLDTKEPQFPYVDAKKPSLRMEAIRKNSKVKRY